MEEKYYTVCVPRDALAWAFLWILLVILVPLFVIMNSIIFIMVFALEAMDPHPLGCMAKTGESSSDVSSPLIIRV